MTLEQQYFALKERVARAREDIEAKKVRLAEVLKEKDVLVAKKALNEQCIQLFQNLSIDAQKEMCKKIEDIVTKIYREVFENEDSFVIDLDVKRKTPTASFYIKTKKHGKDVLLDPLEEDGGGKVDIISLGLRIAGLLLFKPELNRVLIFEAFKIRVFQNHLCKTVQAKSRFFVKKDL